MQSSYFAGKICNAQLAIFLQFLPNFCHFFAACRFRGERTGEKLIRLSEATPVGTEAFRVLAFPRRNFNIQALDGVSLYMKWSDPQSRDLELLLITTI